MTALLAQGYIAERATWPVDRGVFHPDYHYEVTAYDSRIYVQSVDGTVMDDQPLTDEVRYLKICGPWLLVLKKPGIMSVIGLTPGGFGEPLKGAERIRMECGNTFRDAFISKDGTMLFAAVSNQVLCISIRDGKATSLESIGFPYAVEAIEPIYKGKRNIFVGFTVRTISDFYVYTLENDE